ncbi:MAG TPA: hypothetical protein VF002_06030 [Gaiellaceae bacterium]
MRLLLPFLAAIALVPAASGAVRGYVTPNKLTNHADPALLRTSQGVLVAYAVQSTGSVVVIDAAGASHTVVSGWPAVSDPQLVQKPAGTIFLYFGGATPDLKTSGLLRFSSSNGGVSWSGPFTTNPASTIGDVQAAAVRRDGTPLFSQDGTGFINVYQGDNGETLNNAFSPCCGYDESLAVEFSGLAQLAFWSNANPSSKSGYLYEILDASGAPAGQPVNLAAGTDVQAQPAINRVPLVADGVGNTFMAWPGTSHVTLAALGAGKLKRKFAIATGGSPAQVALALEPDGGKLWVVWTRGSYLWATRLRDAAHAAAPILVRTKLPSGETPYALEAVGLNGRVEAVVNVGGSSGNALWTADLVPGLAAHASRSPKPMVKIRDDIAPVRGAMLRGGGKVAQTNAKGLASLKGFTRHALVKVTKPGYAATSFRVP